MRCFRWSLLIDNLEWLGSASLAGVWNVIAKHEGIEGRVKMAHESGARAAADLQAFRELAHGKRHAGVERDVAAAIKRVALLETSTMQTAEALFAQLGAQRQRVDAANATISELRKQIASTEAARREDVAALRKETEALRRAFVICHREIEAMRDEAARAARNAIDARLAEVEHEPRVAAIALSNAARLSAAIAKTLEH